MPEVKQKIELNDWQTAEDADRLLTEAILANPTLTGRELTLRVVAYAYQCGRMDERNQ